MPLLRLLEWDTRFFGIRIGRLDTGELSHDDIPAITSWCKTNGVECLYFLTEASDTKSIHAAESSGFRMMDLRVTLKYIKPFTPNNGDIHIAKTTDLPALKSMVQGTFLDTRFYRDPRLEKHALKLYETWIERDANNPEGVVLISNDAESGEPAGFISCRYSNAQKTGEISLVAVGHKFRGKGIGSSLVKSAQTWFLSKGAEQLSVVTNGSNLTAQRLYQRHGFYIERMQIWFHHWNPQT